MKNINVLHLIPTSKFSGAEKVIEQICLNINKEKYNMFIICSGGELYNKYAKNNFNVFKLNVNTPGLKKMLEYSNFLKAQKIDIVHAHGIRASLFALLAKLLFRLNIIIISHIHETSDWLRSKGINKLIDRLIRNHFSINILCGKHVFEHYTTYGKYIDISRIRVISNSVDLLDINKYVNDILVNKYKNNDDFIFGFVGRFTKVKGLVPLITKLIENKEVLENAKLILVGDGEEADELKRKVIKNDLGGRIMFVGYQENIYDYIAIFDLLILPSISEGLPMVILKQCPWVSQFLASMLVQFLR